MRLFALCIAFIALTFVAPAQQERVDVCDEHTFTVIPLVQSDLPDGVTVVLNGWAITNSSIRPGFFALADTFTAEWYSNGIKVVVIVERLGGEPAPKYAKRCREQVDAQLALFPKDP